MQKSAILSPCSVYRYELRRVWGANKPLVLFIGLNPSTADHEQEDSTSRVCINYAKRWGYGGLVIANLFAYRSTDPRGLYQAVKPIGPDNDVYLQKLACEAKETVCAWSDYGGYLNRDLAVLPLLKSPKCLTILKSGRPGHPLYKSRILTPVPLKPIVPVLG